MVLDLDDYPVLEAPDGQSGLEVLRTSATPLVVLVDYLMPRMNGLELLRAVASDPLLAHRHAYLLVTANYDRLPAEAADLLATVGLETVHKPFDIALLLGVVERACRRLQVAAVEAASAQTPEPPL